jgi:hypothetical protein
MILFYAYSFGCMDFPSGVSEWNEVLCYLYQLLFSYDLGLLDVSQGGVSLFSELSCICEEGDQDHGFKGVKASRRLGDARRLGAQGGQFFKAEVQRLDA